MYFIISCQKTIDKFPVPGDPSAVNTNTATRRNTVIYVSSVDELYAAVNNVNNAGAEVILAPGVYVLNASYPNGGRLELQTDMSLRGQAGQTDVVINGVLLKGLATKKKEAGMQDQADYIVSKLPEAEKKGF